MQIVPKKCLNLLIDQNLKLGPSLKYTLYMYKMLMDSVIELQLLSQISFQIMKESTSAIKQTNTIRGENPGMRDPMS